MLGLLAQTICRYRSSRPPLTKAECCANSRARPYRAGYLLASHQRSCLPARSCEGENLTTMPDIEPIDALAFSLHYNPGAMHCWSAPASHQQLTSRLVRKLRWT